MLMHPAPISETSKVPSLRVFIFMSSSELSGRLVRSFYDLPCNLDPVTSEGRQSTRHPRQFEHRGTSLRWVRDLNPPSDRPGKTLSDESPCIPSAGSPFHG